MPKVHERKAAKDYPDHGIKKGEQYYTWKLKTGPVSGITYRSKTYPRASQLTASKYYSTLYELQERTQHRDDEQELEELISDLDDIANELDDLSNDQEEKRENLPEGLQEGPTGELLQERYEQAEMVAESVRNAQVYLEALKEE